MPVIKDKELFRPNKIKDLWLKTRKEGLHGTKHPGFFQTVNYSTDRNWFLIALGIEIAAIVITIQGGWTRMLLGSGVGYFIGAIAVAIVFILLDLIGTRLHHRPIGEKHKAKCDYALLEIQEEDKNKKAAVLAQLSLKDWKKTLGLFLIILSAILKLVALFLLGTIGIVVVAIMTVLYLLVIYIHVYHTGYWYYEWLLGIQMNRQHALWNNYNRLLKNGKEAEASQHKGKEHTIGNKTESSTVVVKEPLWYHEDEDLNTSITDSAHKIIFIKKKDSSYYYEIQTCGIFTDQDISNLINTGNGVNRNIVALFCLKHQLGIEND